MVDFSISIRYKDNVFPAIIRSFDDVLVDTIMHELPAINPMEIDVTDENSTLFLNIRDFCLSVK